MIFLSFADRAKTLNTWIDYGNGNPRILARCALYICHLYGKIREVVNIERAISAVL